MSELREEVVPLGVPESDGGETGGYDPPPRQQRQIWFWLNLIGTKEKEQVS